MNKKLKTKTHIKAGGFVPNNSRNMLKVKTHIKAAGIDPWNHNRNMLKVK